MPGPITFTSSTAYTGHTSTGRQAQTYENTATGFAASRTTGSRGDHSNRRAFIGMACIPSASVYLNNSSRVQVVDARATMAIYRLHRKTWEVDMPHSHLLTSKRSRAEVEDSEDADGADVTKEKPEVQKFPGGGRKGISSGLSTIVKRRGETKTKTSWWKEVGGGSKRTLP